MSETRAEWLASRPQLGGLGLGDYTASELIQRLARASSNCEVYSYGVYLMDLDTWLHWLASGVSLDEYKEHYPRWDQPKWRYVQHKDAVKEDAV